MHITIVAPASGISPDKLETLKIIASQRSFELNFPDNLLANDNSALPYHANTDEKRLRYLKAALWDPSDAIVWTLRGGYGSARLLDNLRQLPVPQHKKIFIGFSDNTALHLFLSQQWGWKTIHGAGIAQLLDPEHDPQNFSRILTLIHAIKQGTTPIFLDCEPINHTAEKHTASYLHGYLTGGNLTLVENSIGTHWQIQAADKILLLEDVGEKGYRIDRSLYHLYQASIFKHVKAIVLGDFMPVQDDPTLIIALDRFANDMDKIALPVYKTSQCGHGKINYPWAYNVLY